jgi:hypothetical protein
LAGTISVFGGVLEGVALGFRALDFNPIPSTGINPLGVSRYAYLKLSVSVPPQLAVAIDGGSGDIVAESLESLDFHSGSGDLEADQITGALSLELGSALVTWLSMMWPAILRSAQPAAAM